MHYKEFVGKINVILNFLKKIRTPRKKVASLIFGILFVVYFVVISSYWGRVDGFNKAMIVLGILWILFSLKSDKLFSLLKKLPKFVKIILKTCLIIIIASFLLVEGVIIYNMKATSTIDADYVIILGCQVDGSIPSIPLIRRVNTALGYLDKHKNTKVVITGGKGPGENITEAEAMKRILLRNGIEENRIFEEHNARSTMENLKLSNELYNLLEKNIVIVSSDYHMFRALSMAKKLHYINANGLPSRSQLSVLPAYLLREYVAVVYYILLGRI